MRYLVSFVWRAALAAVAFTAGTMVGGWIASGVGAVLPEIPSGVDARGIAFLVAMASFVVALALAPLAAGLAVGVHARWVMLALLAYVCLGPNTAIEAAIFTTVGGTSGMLVLNVFSSALLAVGLAVLFRPPSERPGWRASWRAFRGQFGAAQWTWRLAAAVLAFPLIYLVFGMMAGPFVVDAYRAENFGLVLPGLGQILAVQLARSVLFLLASLPLLAAWGGSRRRLVLTLGIAQFALIGLFGMLQAVWLPVAMRLVHSVEILGDSMAYAAVLVTLLVRSRETDRAEKPALSEAA